MIRPATPDELDELQAFDNCGAEVAELVADKQDALSRWNLLGVMTQDGVRRVYLRMSGGGAVAYVQGDGRRFGVAGAPSSAELAAATSHFRVS